MSYLYFELKESDARRAEYESLLHRHSEACESCVKFLLRAIEFMSVSSSHPDMHFPGVVFLLARHAAEELDAISVLVASGCAQPCKLHLRSLFEAGLGVHYILKGNSEERALTFHVAEIHKRIRDKQRLDPNTEAGRKVRAETAHDPIGADILASISTTDFRSEVERLENGLNSPRLVAVEVEWQRTVTKLKKKLPLWHSLFDGPVTIRDLAYHLEKGFWYEFQYGDWSEAVHATSALKQVAKIKQPHVDGGVAIRPLRNPNGLRTVCDLATGMAIEMEQTIADHFLGPVAKTILDAEYMNKVRPSMESLGECEINADWF